MGKLEQLFLKAGRGVCDDKGKKVNFKLQILRQLVLADPLFEDDLSEIESYIPRGASSEIDAYIIGSYTQQRPFNRLEGDWVFVQSILYGIKK